MTPSPFATSSFTRPVTFRNFLDMLIEGGVASVDLVGYSPCSETVDELARLRALYDATRQESDAQIAAEALRIALSRL